MRKVGLVLCKLLCRFSLFSLILRSQDAENISHRSCFGRAKWAFDKAV